MGSRVADVKPVIGGVDLKSIKKFGDSTSWRTDGEDSPVQRHRKKVKPNKKLKKRGFDDEMNHAKQYRESVVNEIIEEMLDETVRQKKGGGWAIFDDETGAEIATFSNRKDAWARQRILRQQKKLASDKVKKPKATKKAQVKPTPKKTPKVNKVRGISKIKPIKPIKPIRPKGLKATPSQRESFEAAVAQELLGE